MGLSLSLQQANLGRSGDGRGQDSLSSTPQAHFKLLLVSYLLVSHWPRQVHSQVQSQRGRILQTYKAKAWIREEQRTGQFLHTCKNHLSFWTKIPRLLRRKPFSILHPSHLRQWCECVMLGAAAGTLWPQSDNNEDQKHQYSEDRNENPWGCNQAAEPALCRPSTPNYNSTDVLPLLKFQNRQN